MKVRLVRFLFALHRWSGVVLGLLMLLWCLSGFVMIWSPYPSTTLGDRDYRVEGLAPIRLPDQIALPEIPAEAQLSTARVEMLAERPVITLAWQAGEGGDRGTRGGPQGSRFLRSAPIRSRPPGGGVKRLRPPQGGGGRICRRTNPSGVTVSTSARPRLLSTVAEG